MFAKPRAVWQQRIFLENYRYYMYIFDLDSEKALYKCHTKNFSSIDHLGILDLIQTSTRCSLV
jgi:hypothetical protein